jgi:hypothetical protein
MIAWITSNAWKLTFHSDFCGHKSEYLPGALLFQAVTEANRAGRERSLNSISAILQNQTWKRGEKQHRMFSLPLIDNDNKSLFMGGQHKSCLSEWWNKGCKIILWSSSVIQLQGGCYCYALSLVMVIAGLASGRKAVSKQKGRGNKQANKQKPSVLERPECLCNRRECSVLSVIYIKHGIRGWSKSNSNQGMKTCSIRVYLRHHY